MFFLLEILVFLAHIIADKIIVLNLNYDPNDPVKKNHYSTNQFDKLIMLLLICLRCASAEMITLL
jgi:hypothetical protein